MLKKTNLGAMKLIRNMSFLLVLLLGLNSKLAAFQEFVVGVEWIYFSPISESFRIGDHAFTEPPGSQNEIQKAIHNRLDDFHSGYRIHGYTNFCDFTLAARLTHFEVHHNKSFSVTGDDLIINPFSTLITDFASTARDFKKFHYFSVEGVLGWVPFATELFELNTFGGFHYARIRSNDHYFYAITELTTTPFLVDGRYKNHFWGIGPELGFNLNGNLGCNLCLHWEAMAAFVIGKLEAFNHFDEIDPATGVTFTQGSVDPRSHWRTVPYGNMRVGLNYLFYLPQYGFCCRNLYGTLEIGYEGLIYFDALWEIQFITDSRTFRHVILHGPYLSFDLYF